MAVTIRNAKVPPDEIARAHRRSKRIRASIIGVAAVTTVVLGTWLLFGASVFAVTSITIEGGSDVVRIGVHTALDELFGQRALGILRPTRNIIFLNTARVDQFLREKFPIIKEMSVKKGYPHTLEVELQERSAIGTWCEPARCQYFDETGARWGDALPSRGPLLLFVEDQRDLAEKDYLREFHAVVTVKKELPSVGLHPLTIAFPKEAPGDMTVRVIEGYDVKIDAQSSVQEQIDTLGVFLADKATDTTWKPQYVDLRTSGRVYYK